MPLTTSIYKWNELVMCDRAMVRADTRAFFRTLKSLCSILPHSKGCVPAMRYWYSGVWLSQLILLSIADSIQSPSSQCGSRDLQDAWNTVVGKLLLSYLNICSLGMDMRDTELSLLGWLCTPGLWVPLRKLLFTFYNPQWLEPWGSHPHTGAECCVNFFF